ncbi:MAG TPA: hypothetical protein VEX13_01105 [Chloroflexia bacterium]|nr:hypothetical protein [Chloroflexia bacterium]
MSNQQPRHAYQKGHIVCDNCRASNPPGAILCVWCSNRLPVKGRNIRLFLFALAITAMLVLLSLMAYLLGIEYVGVPVPARSPTPTPLHVQ